MLNLHIIFFLINKFYNILNYNIFDNYILFKFFYIINILCYFKNDLDILNNSIIINYYKFT